MQDIEKLDSFRDDIDLSFSVRKSLTKPKLVAGLERKLFGAIVFVPLIFALTLESLYGYIGAFIVFGMGWIAGRYLTRFDPFFFETMVAYLRHCDFYGYGESPSYNKKFGSKNF